MDNNLQLQFPGKLIAHRYQPTESPRTVFDNPSTEPQFASEVGFNPIATMLYGRDQVFVKSVNNTTVRMMRPVASEGKVTLPVRGERIFELTPEFKAEFEGRLQSLSSGLKQPLKTGGIGFAVPAFKQTITPSNSRKLLPALTIANHKAKAVINGQLRPVLVPDEQAADATTVLTPAFLAPREKIANQVLMPKQVVSSTSESQPKPAVTAPIVNLSQEARTIVGIRARLSQLIIELNVGRYRQSLLLPQMVETFEERAIAAYKAESEPVKKAYPDESDRLKSLELILPKSALAVFAEKEISSKDVANHLITWLAAFDEVLVGYNAVLKDLVYKPRKVSVRQESPPPTTLPQNVKFATPPLAELSNLAAKLLGTRGVTQAKPTYVPINLAAKQPVSQPLTETAKSSAANLARASSEAIKAISKPPAPPKEVVAPSAELIAKEVAAQLQKEKSKLEEEITEQLRQQEKALEQKKQVIQALEQPPLVQEAAPVSPAAAPKVVVEKTQAAPPTSSPEAAAIKEPPPIRVVIETGNVARASDEGELQQTFVKTEGVINTLALDQLSSGERENLLSRLRGLENQAEVMRQYDDLRYQKEKERLGAEIKILVEEATQKSKKAEVPQDQKALEVRQSQEAARKTKVAQEVKELVAREKSRQGRSTSVVAAVPAYGKMVPPKVSFPNVLNGIVRDRQGLLLSGVVMIIKDSLGEPVRALRTNKIGQFVISTPLPSGTYKIELEKDGCDFNIVQIELTGEVMNPIEIRGL